jgi:hypothetical protein
MVPTGHCGAGVRSLLGLGPFGGHEALHELLAQHGEAQARTEARQCLARQGPRFHHHGTLGFEFRTVGDGSGIGGSDKLCAIAVASLPLVGLTRVRGAVADDLVDNKWAKDVSNNWSVGGRLRHIDFRQFFLRNLKEDGRIVQKWILTDDNSSDLFTKNLHGPAFEKHAKALVDKDEYMQ